ncbi:hypothetical protein BU26DRAFT_563525 [Trematosphaeria pertusa]|uniref:Uncharacterized protein n=1 Tax=Trematosphaeria pertusa TaxID=390896 RepID=A0A6A6IGS2_9PLEO|nr:uncharacterized protein BU26DRAFT_563525 [Trematosphaeria pertusa]KAF2249621.1 hypothetical protein BU26DRAFT_563525 [Trematosphaeria pertusa]
MSSLQQQTASAPTPAPAPASSPAPQSIVDKPTSPVSTHVPATPPEKPKVFAKPTQEYAEYQAWVNAGGLDKFAKDNSLEPDFLSHLCSLPPATTSAYILAVHQIPGMSDAIAAHQRLWTGSSFEQGLQDIAAAYGDYDSSCSESEDETSKHEDSEQTGLCENQGEGPECALVLIDA